MSEFEKNVDDAVSTMTTEFDKPLTKADIEEFRQVMLGVVKSLKRKYEIKKAKMSILPLHYEYKPFFESKDIYGDQDKDGFRLNMSSLMLGPVIPTSHPAAYLMPCSFDSFDEAREEERFNEYVDAHRMNRILDAVSLDEALQMMEDGKLIYKIVGKGEFLILDGELVGSWGPFVKDYGLGQINKIKEKL